MFYSAVHIWVIVLDKEPQVVEILTENERNM